MSFRLVYYLHQENHQFHMTFDIESNESVLYIFAGGVWWFSGCTGLVVVAMTMYYAHQRGPVTSAKHSILEYVTGKYLAIQYSKVSWDWDEPQSVGKTVTFKIKVRS